MEMKHDYFEKMPTEDKWLQISRRSEARQIRNEPAAPSTIVPTKLN